jgi:hypothetical protein
MKMSKVRIAIIITPWVHVNVTANQRIQQELKNYHNLGFKINKQEKSAQNGDLIYYFIADDDHKEMRLRGGTYHDVVSNRTEDETRIRNYNE